MVNQDKITGPKSRQKVNILDNLLNLFLTLFKAPYGQPGMSGQSAAAPTAGQPASDIRIRLAYSSEETGIVQVTGEGSHTGQLWKIARDEKLRLNVKGGDGGAGGRGEDGQAGGQGRNGRDATRHRNGEDGEDGARGGE
jgi:hypothetical protein